MILFFGPAGAGKSVQGQMLAARHGWRWISTGQLFRETHDLEILKTINEGSLISDEQTISVVNAALKRSKEDTTQVILDGFPRRHTQAQWLVETHSKGEHSIDLAIVIEVPRAELAKRLKVRGRLDDTPESIEKRLSIYRQEIYPILSYFAEQEIAIAHVEGDGSIGQVHDRVEAEVAAALKPNKKT